MKESPKNKNREVIVLDDERNSKKPEVVEVCGVPFTLIQ